MRDLRGNRLAMIFQEPMTSLNPGFTVGDQIGEALLRHRGWLAAAGARARHRDAASACASPRREQRIDDYPHKLSGGMRQRVMIAMALACEPALLIADEPTTALDVTIQAQILDLLRELQRSETGTAIILITHDLGVVAEIGDEVAVMYAGEIVERAPVGELFAAPQHPYTVGLLGSIPRLDAPRERLRPSRACVPDLTQRRQPAAASRRAARSPIAALPQRAPPPLADVGARGHRLALLEGAAGGAGRHERAAARGRQL